MTKIENQIKEYLREGDDILNEENNPKKAIKIFEKILKLDNKHAKTWSRIGQSLMRMERYTQAIVPFKNAVENDPKDIYSW